MDSCRQRNAQPGWWEVVKVARWLVGKCELFFDKLNSLISTFQRDVFLFQLSNIRFSRLIGKHVIKGTIITYSASIFFIEEAKSHIPLCLKMWRFRNDGVYDTTTAEKRTRYIMDGLQFNQRFAPGVHLGIVRMGNINKQRIVIKQWIAQPEKEEVSPSRRYAVVMKRLPDEWQLDIQLEKTWLDTPQMLKFLAREVARMHKMLEVSPLKEMGSVASLEKKLHANVALLRRINCVQDKKERNERIVDLLLEVFRANEESFEERWREGRIKRCHGDLKASNLWLRPAQRLRPPKLLALDCIDFNRPDFCHIDTLCDIAMLAINLEHSFMRRLGEKKGRELVEIFLTTYLAYTNENDKKAPLMLEYYMAEKAIVCAYTSDIYDNLPLNVVDTYLELALMHVGRLRERLPVSVEQQFPNRSENTEVVLSNRPDDTLESPIPPSEQKRGDMVLV